MPRLPRLTPRTAGASRDILSDLVSLHGQAGEMVSTMAHSPAVLNGYLHLSRSMKGVKLDRRISAQISIAVQMQQGCGLCLDAHTEAAHTAGVTEDEIEQARAGTSANPATAAIIDLALKIYREPTAITDEQVLALYDHGFSDREIIDVVGIVSLNILTGAFNLVAGLSPGRPTGQQKP